MLLEQLHRSLAIFLFASQALASETITAEPGESAKVWKQLIDVGSWMYEFDLTLESGTPGQEGEVRRLYAGQDFFIEITKLIPGQLLVFANLPATVNGEHSTGVAVITLDEVDNATLLNLAMSRRYTWSMTDPNPNRADRESPEFQERTRAMWEDRFLLRLKTLVEGR